MLNLKKEMNYQPIKTIEGTLNAYLLNSWSQSEKTTYFMISNIWYSGKDKTMEKIKIYIYGCQVLGEEKEWIGKTQIFSTVKLLSMIL